jgi:hypothetical protein
MKKYILIPVTAAVLALSSGCAIGIGNRDHDVPRHTTLGQELTDLKTARDSGVLSESEYHEQRERLMEH